MNGMKPNARQTCESTDSIFETPILFTMIRGKSRIESNAGQNLDFKTSLWLKSPEMSYPWYMYFVAVASA